MKYKQSCECCGHNMTAYTHNLNKPLVNALIQLTNFYWKMHKPANLQKNLNLSKNQYNNFQKLQYFRLVKRIEKGWLPTEDGLDFVDNKIMIQSPVATLGKNILPLYHDAWKTHSGKVRRLYISDIIGYQYKTRPEYQEEKSNQASLI